jgi:hypothetical protein
VGPDNLLADPPNAVRNCSRRGVTAGGILERSSRVIPLVDTFSVLVRVCAYPKGI